jgi:hypothetical protein
MRVRQPGTPMPNEVAGHETRFALPAHWEPASPKAPPSRPDHRGARHAGGRGKPSLFP